MTNSGYCAGNSDRLGIELTSTATKLLHKYLAKAASELARLFTEQLGERADTDAKQLEQTFASLRSVSLDATRLIFAREMEQALRDMVQSGAAARIDKKKRKRKRKR